MAKRVSARRRNRVAGATAPEGGQNFAKMCKILFDGVRGRNMLLSR